MPPLPTAEDLVRQAEAVIPTPYGDFLMIAYSDSATDYAPHLALVHPEMDPEKPVVIRMHSECITGDLFGSKRCDCGEQLDFALTQAAAKKGMVIYLRQEGRGIGIINKLKAYQLQDTGLDTIEANLHLGLEVDSRQYDIAEKILEDLQVSEVKLLTNNPTKIYAFDNSDIKMVERLPIVIPAVKENEDYLRTKEESMGHLFK
ncbi:GTP cyclohydrolase II [Lewinellaceae bacterium SD302]|nr:GTP cyclohydrolase II [Lewinellaceae bacterium SD302]